MKWLLWYMSSIFLVSVIILLAVLCRCTTANNPSSAAEKQRVYLKATLYKYVDNANLKRSDNTFLSSVPCSILVFAGDTITAELESFVSNYAINHPQCDCKEMTDKLYHTVCTQKIIVASDTVWVVGD